MSFVEQPFFGREIAVPAKLPMILKQFCKAAIRTQPHDLLKWSGSYFRALADGEEPPVKSRLEYPPPSTASGLTLGFLRVLLRQFGNYNKTLPIEIVLHRWDCLCLDRKDFDAIVTIGKFQRTCQVKKFLAIAVGLLGASLTETMILICQLFTHEPDGGSAMIPLTLFMETYEYLAGLICDGSEKSARDRDATERKDSSVDRTSINSQDTDMDINLDSELISKDEIVSSKTDLSIEPMANSSFEKELDNEEKETDISLASRRDNFISNDCSKSKNNTIDKKFCGIDNVNSDGSLVFEIEKDGEITCHLNVPGIGSRLPAEQIASVATWMLECAKLQEGMVGPRNIRHINCPSLHE
ncbi:Ropporin-1-like protein [Camponotus floridanus]|uniref:Ropporin-1-like protein n=1 Tax=Camponotus floridanus TaxID=104421 RepID=E1ZUT7_CAMFO|nr:ropporin-1-like protein [Camponotus floridanus]EFN75029.1 Ropporin-1-like protein [Camponotus floridanus]